MDIKGFELTEEEIPIWLGGNYFRECANKDGVITKYKLRVDKPSFEAGYQYAISKVLSLLEPVELEALGDEEINNATHVADDTGVPINGDAFYGIDLNDLRNLVQATIRKNQKKQLYRISEGK